VPRVTGTYPGNTSIVRKGIVIGDHVVFWNHRAYDFQSIGKVHNARRLENAIAAEDQQGGRAGMSGSGQLAQG